jgi:Flp pilus assembly CpaF family ATPase
VLTRVLEDETRARRQTVAVPHESVLRTVHVRILPPVGTALQPGTPTQGRDVAATEVMVNGPDDVYVERKGRIERVADRLFEGEESVHHLIERIVAPLGLRVDATSPWVDADCRTVRGCTRSCRLFRSWEG